MCIQDYKDTYKSYSPAQKVDLLLDIIDHYGFCRAMSHAAHNPYEKSVYCHEVDDKELKIKWLCEEIKKALEEHNGSQVQAQ